jgi:hypothetical protein
MAWVRDGPAHQRRPTAARYSHMRYGTHMQAALHVQAAQLTTAVYSSVIDALAPCSSPGQTHRSQILRGPHVLDELQLRLGAHQHGASKAKRVAVHGPAALRAAGDVHQEGGAEKDVVGDLGLPRVLPAALQQRRARCLQLLRLHVRRQVGVEGCEGHGAQLQDGQRAASVVVCWGRLLRARGCVDGDLEGWGVGLRFDEREGDDLDMLVGLAAA